MRIKIEGIFVVALFAVFFLSSIVFAVDCPIPDTGQTKCYNDTQEIICPQPGNPFYGQDAQYITNPPSYTKLDENGDELLESAVSWVMVRDNVTGLIWEVKTDDETIHDKDDTYNWQNAQDVFVADLNSNSFGGFDDWRLPTAKELAFIRSVDNFNPAINTDYFPNTESHHHWTSTSCVFDTSYAFYVGFNGGLVSYVYGEKISNKYVRAVRGEQFSNSFVDNGNGTVTDTSTGLMWQVDGSHQATDWEDALLYCENLILNNDGEWTSGTPNASGAKYDDWRLPDFNELHTLVDYSTYNPAINTTFFLNTQEFAYFSSTSHQDSTNIARGVAFVYGEATGYGKEAGFYVRAVRGGAVLDSEADGISDGEDKCPCHPNGLNKGTCVKNVGSVIMSYEEGGELITCNDDIDCTPTGGYCQKVQGDYNWNGIGDVCEGYADFDNSGGVNLADLLDLILCYGKTNF